MRHNKKRLALIVAVAMIFALSGCGAGSAICTKGMKASSSAELGEETAETMDETADSADIAMENTGTEDNMAAPADPVASDTASASEQDNAHAAKAPAFGKKPNQNTAQSGTQSGDGNQSNGSTQSGGGSQSGGSTQSGGGNSQSGGSSQSSGGTQSGGGSQSGGGTQSGGSSQSGGTQSGGTQSGGTQSNGGSQKHEHYWKPVYGTKHHEEVGHYENVEVKAAWDEPQYEGKCVCSACGAKFDSVTAVGDHISDAHGGAGSYSVKQFVSGYIHHDAEYKQEWIVDQAAWDESVVTGYECICGEKKSA